ncbi:MAG: hypothetical protein QOJ35_3090 [Solirubrobacteraceae bacterium]|nr:hypothetical protein [Solirubrobacteraceae bacterium]
MTRQAAVAWPIAVAALLACGCGPLAATARSAVAPTFFAVNAGPVLFTLSPEALATQLEAIRAAGIGQVRTDSGWHLAEPRAPVGGVHRYDWAYSDRVAAALARAGLRWYALLDYGTPWAGIIPGDAMSPPADVGAYAAYAAAFAGRYGPAGSFWRERPELPVRPVLTLEMWNEPNVTGFWHPLPDPASYAKLLAAAAVAVATVDASLRVVVGGLDNTGPSLFEGPRFLAAMLAARPDLRGMLAGVAIHDYNTTPDARRARLLPMRALVDSLLGPDVALDITEIGWPTAGVLPPVLIAPPVSEKTRAGLYRGLVDELSRSDCTIGLIAPYAWLTPEGAPLNQNDFFGIASRDGSLKPSAVAFEEAVLRSESRPAGPALDVCHRPGAGPPDVPGAAPPAAPRLRLRVRLAARSACRRGRALLRVRVVGGTGTVEVRVDGGRRRTLAVPAGGALRVRLPASARVVVVVAPAAGGRRSRSVVRVRGRCAGARRASGRAAVAR